MYLVKYRISRELAPDDKLAASRAALSKYAELGDLEGTIGHWSSANMGGYLLIDASLESVYERITVFAPYFIIEVEPVLPIEQSLGYVAAAVAE